MSVGIGICPFTAMARFSFPVKFTVVSRMYKSYRTVCGGVLFTIVFTAFLFAFGIGILLISSIGISIFFLLAVSFDTFISTCLCVADGCTFSTISFIPHLGQFPGFDACISGCIEQV